MVAKTPTRKTAAKQTTAKPAAKAVAKTAPAVEESAEEEIFGVASIAEILTAETGKTVKTRDLRTLLRKMARDGRLDREIVPGNRERWIWSGAEDPEVEKILEAFRNGELEADKQEKLQALKDRKAAQKAAEKASEADEVVEDEEITE